MLNNGQIYFKNHAFFTPQDFQNMFGHFSLLCMKALKKEPNKYWHTSMKWSFYILSHEINWRSYLAEATKK